MLYKFTPEAKQLACGVLCVLAEGSVALGQLGLMGCTANVSEAKGIIKCE